ncbi:MAG TPA: hypothetical protein VFQ80_11890 [Thermomicrobiales bacterium]|nr:hypothetical protein [Thermomicrobiales bacterium]
MEWQDPPELAERCPVCRDRATGRDSRDLAAAVRFIRERVGLPPAATIIVRAQTSDGLKELPDRLTVVSFFAIVRGWPDGLDWPLVGWEGQSDWYVLIGLSAYDQMAPDLWLHQFRSWRRPEVAPKIEISGTETRPTRRQRERLHAADALFYDTAAARGRPADCYDEIDMAAAKIAASGHRLTQRAVAEYLRSYQDERGIAECMRRERRRTGRSWRDILRKYQTFR